ncbi:MAG: 16S rRNA (guanine(966)-N(2))-methyltransferase RsmD [Pseudomonadota bacterium]
MSRGGIRIIGGRWRGRRLAVPPGKGLRPTPDRVRETLFNWLSPRLTGARCLDLFAGSGALGLEALSRGAAETVLVERAAPVARHLREQVAALEAEGAIVVQSDARRFLEGEVAAAGGPFDIVFLDPPFDSDLLDPAMAALEAGGWLAEGAAIHVESPSAGAEPAWPEGWQPHRGHVHGEVRYDLLLRGGETS